MPIDRAKLEAIMRRTPTPTKQQAAKELGYSKSWVSEMIYRWNLPRREPGRRGPNKYRNPKHEEAQVCIDLIRAFRERCGEYSLNHEHELARLLTEWLERH